MNTQTFYLPENYQENYDPDLIDTPSGRAVILHFEIQYPKVSREVKALDYFNPLMCAYVNMYMDEKTKHIHKGEDKFEAGDSAFGKITSLLNDKYQDLEEELSGIAIMSKTEMKQIQSASLN